MRQYGEMTWIGCECVVEPHFVRDVFAGLTWEGFRVVLDSPPNPRYIEYQLD